MKKAYPRLEEAFFKYKLIEGAVSPTKESYKRLSHCHYYNIGRQEKTKHGKSKACFVFCKKGFLPGMSQGEFIRAGTYFLPFSAMVKKFSRIFPPSGVIMDSG